MRETARARPAADAVANQGGQAALEALARAARQVSLYGREHPIAVEALEEACRDLIAAAGEKTLEVRVEDDGLMWQGSLLRCEGGPVSRFREAMRERLMAAVCVEPGVGAGELADLLGLLAEEAEEVASSGGPTQRLAQAGAGKIRIEEFDFGGTLRESEAMRLESWGQMDAEALDPLKRTVEFCLLQVGGGASGGGAAGLGGILGGTEVVGEGEPEGGDVQRERAEALARAVARVIQEGGSAALAAGRESWAAWRQEMARNLGAVGAQWRARIFRAPVGESGEELDMLAALARELSLEQCVSLVLDHPDSIRLERSEGLGRALTRIMADPERARAIEPVLRQEALRRGCPADVYENVVGVLRPRLAGAEGEGRGPGGSGARGAATSEHGQGEDLSDLLKTTRPRSAKQARRKLLAELVERELTVEQYRSVVGTLVDTAEACAREQDTEGLVSALRVLSEEAGGEEKGEKGRRGVAARALKRAGSERVVRYLAAQMERASTREAGELIALLGALGERGMGAVVGAAGKAGEFYSDQAIRVIAERDNLSFSYLRRLLSKAPTSELPRMLRTLVATGDPRVIAQLVVAADHPSVTVRLELAAVIEEAGEVAAVEAAVRLLSDPVASVRMAAVKAAVKLRAREAVLALCELARNESGLGEGAAVKEAAVRALGEMGQVMDGTVVRTLREVLQEGGLLAMLGGRRHRLAAAEALGRIGTAEAKEALVEGTRDRRRGVRAACRRALERVCGEASDAG